MNNNEEDSIMDDAMQAILNESAYEEYIQEQKLKSLMKTIDDPKTKKEIERQMKIGSKKKKSWLLKTLEEYIKHPERSKYYKDLIFNKFYLEDYDRGECGGVQVTVPLISINF